MKKIIHQDGLEIKTPYSKTGSENTKKGIEALFDWVSFTFPFNGLKDLERVKQVLDIPSEDLVVMPKGAHGYKSQLRCGHISILYDGNPDMGINVNISGQGCREYEARFGNKWKDLFRHVFELDGHFARLDTALDDYRGRFTLQDIMNKVLMREVRTLFGRQNEDGSRRPFSIRIEPDFCSAPNVNDGLTVYGGKRQSDLLIRFYDKAVQQGVKYPWVRTEIEFHDDRADIMAKMIVCGGDEELGKIIAGVLRYYVNFLEPSKTDINKARWSVCSWWDEFLGTAEKVRLTINKDVNTIDEKMDWVISQVATTAALIDIHLQIEGKESLDYFFKGLIENGKERLKPHHYALLQAR